MVSKFVSPETDPLQVNEKPLRVKFVNSVSFSTEPPQVNDKPLRNKYVNNVSPEIEPVITDKLRLVVILIAVQYFKYEISSPLIAGAFVESVKA